MSADRRLPRWSEQGSEAPAELRQWLRASREQLAAPDEVERLSRALAERLGSEQGLAPARAPALVKEAWLGAGRWALWLSVGAGTVAAVGYWQSEPPAVVQPFVTPVVVQPSVPQPSVPQPASALAAPTAASAPQRAEVLPPADAAPEPPPARALLKAPPTSEAELLRRAQRALADHPAQALALSAEHRRRYAEGALAEEREVIAIEALRRLGRERLAQRRAAAFELSYPNSVHRSRVQATPVAP